MRWILVILPLAVAAAVATAAVPGGAAGPAPTYRVFAARLGLVGATTANGHVIRERDRFVALPSRKALAPKGSYEKMVLVSYKGRRALAPVWDVGPWNTKDNYWDPVREMWGDLPRGVPQAQAAYFDNYNGGLDEQGRKVTAPFGIDIADGTFWDDLGMTHNDWVDVTFLWLGDPPPDLPPTPTPYPEEEAPPATPTPSPTPTPTPTPPPTAPSAPIEGNPNAEYFPQTGHNLAYGFRSFWYANGGLRIFGYPLTDEIVENGLTVQYFERARFEYHPEFPDPYKVTLSLLGRAVTAYRQFDQGHVAASAGDDPLYFPETGHTLRGKFRQFWEANGGLAVFGYPISEEIHEPDANGQRLLKVQYFERQRFEYHPELAGTPFEVQLGLLGREFLRMRGWLE